MGRHMVPDRLTVPAQKAREEEEREMGRLLVAEGSFLAPFEEAPVNSIGGGATKPAKQPEKTN
jgi:hypothetical protein